MLLLGGLAPGVAGEGSAWADAGRAATIAAARGEHRGHGSAEEIHVDSFDGELIDLWRAQGGVV
ncbi:hypothetical protein ACFPOI_33605 [Nonomuraea angiospora]|uniref:Uncharacterized protein n=1 Tax=Nonomuraea angiospora TaxID=46172 RepID=A0ABR9LSZ0_9ACTN|nr:hypothetical protein [Nonomuraea angiospora]MBE1583776.1 hypothetical protein [Nonomuraea angiospora]